MWELHFNNTLFYMQGAMAANNLQMLCVALVKLMPETSCKNSLTQ